MQRNAFLDHCSELLSPLGTVRSNRMFGGHGLYVDEIFVAIVIGERLYLKTEDATRERFAAAGCEPFVYEARGERRSISYWSAPAEAMDSPAQMEPWARLALQAALSKRAAAVKAPGRKNKAAPKAAAPATRAGAKRSAAGAKAAPRRRSR